MEFGKDVYTEVEDLAEYGPEYLSIDNDNDAEEDDE